jgi:uncharacterized membrane-anchored protein
MVTVLVLALAAMLAIAVVLVAGSSTDSYAHLLSTGWHHFYSWLRGLFS